jgi:anti-anti-sigma regulatory factor
MLRLDRRSEAADRYVLTVQGQIVRGWTQLLSEQCAAELARVPAPNLMLDLAQVRYADSEGRRLLRRLVGLGVRLVHCPPLLQAQLDDEASPDEPT